MKEREESVWGSQGLGRENIKIFLLFPGGEGEASSRVGLEMGAGLVPYPEGLVRPG